MKVRNTLFTLFITFTSLSSYAACSQAIVKGEIILEEIPVIHIAQDTLSAKTLFFDDEHISRISPYIDKYVNISLIVDNDSNKIKYISKIETTQPDHINQTYDDTFIEIKSLVCP